MKLQLNSKLCKNFEVLDSLEIAFYMSKLKHLIVTDFKNKRFLFSKRWELKVICE